MDLKRNLRMMAVAWRRMTGSVLWRRGKQSLRCIQLILTLAGAVVDDGSDAAKARETAETRGGGGRRD